MLTVLVLSLSGAMLLHGYTHHMLGDRTVDEPQAGASASAVPKAVLTGGPVIDAAGSAPRTARPRPHTIALTFDDGPDPVWTPKVLDVLRAQKVRATFFVVGTEAAKYPDLVRRIRAEGHQVGLHTFTHANLGRSAGWRQSLELRENQLILAGTAGVTSSLLRPPYAATNRLVSGRDWAAFQRARDQGYLTVLATLDSKDWSRPGVGTIVARSAWHSAAGQVVLMHDGGGDRSQTVAALRVLIPRLKARGFSFATVTDAAGLQEAVRPPNAAERWQGRALAGALQASNALMTLITWLLYGAAALSLLRAAAMLLAARHHARMRRAGWGRPVTAPATVIVPAYNESAGIEAAVRSLVASDHPVEVMASG